MEMVERILAATDIIRNGWLKFRDFFCNFSPVGDKRSSVCQLCRKQHDLWK